MRHKERLETYLRENRVEFQVQPHPPAYTAQEVAATEHVPGRMFAKVVMAMVNGKLTMLVLQAPDAVDLQKWPMRLAPMKCAWPQRMSLPLGFQTVRLALCLHLEPCTTYPCM
jgi:hypothetical protein